MRRRYLLVLLLTGLFFLRGIAQAIHLDFVPPSKEDSWGRVRGITQDKQGFLWLATQGGLYRYDGLTTTAYHNESKRPNSLAYDWVEAIYGGKDDFLLLGTYGSGMDRFDLATSHFTNYRHNATDVSTISNDTVTAIVRDREGCFWVGTHNGLNRFNPKTGTFIRYMNKLGDPSSLSDNQVWAVLEDRQGTLWVGTKSPWPHDGGTRIGGLNRFDPKTRTFIRYMHDPKNQTSLIDNSVTALFEDSHGTFWVGTAGDGLHTMNREQGSFIRHRYDPAHPERLSRPPLNEEDTSYVRDYISFITEDNHGNIWIGTLNGIKVYDVVTKRISHYGTGKDSVEKLTENSFSAGYAARDGTIWIGSHNGNLFKTNPFKTTLPHVAFNKRFMGFQEVNDGVLWISTNKGLIRKAKDGTMQTFLIDKDTTSPKNFMTDVVAADGQNLWIATLAGLAHFNTGTLTFETYNHQAGISNSLLFDSITSVAREGSKLWIGTGYGLDVMDLMSKSFTHYTYKPTDSTSLKGVSFGDEGIALVWDILVSQGNTVWICVGGAVNRLNTNTGRFTRYTVGKYALCLRQGSDGTLWVGTTGGLYRYDKDLDGFVLYMDPLKVLNRNTEIKHILEDRKKNLWLKTVNGFIRLDVSKSEASRYENNGTSFAEVLFRSHITKGGEILSSDTSGYFAFYPDSLLNARPPHIVLSGFTLSDKPVIPSVGSLLSKPIWETAEVGLAYNQNQFSLGFTNIDFASSAEDRHLLYKLENYETRWHKADAEGTADYYNIPPGQYIFKVKAVGSNGIWAEKELPINVALPWWRMWWAYSLYAVLFMLGVYIVHRLQKQRVIRKERERIKERELAQAKEIEQAYHKLKATQQQLIQSEKMASLGELTAGIAHEIQNPLNFVNNFSETNVELLEELKQEVEEGNLGEVKTITTDVIENEKKINLHGKRADAIVKSMLEHARTSKGEKQLTDLNVIVDEYLRLAYHGFRAKDKGFNASIRTNFDESVGRVNLIPQEIGRVLLNLFNNAFFTVAEKRKHAGPDYEPTVNVSTTKLSSKIEIQVQDNGMGIQKSLQDKIFQPFFTTKPTGEGTGLGLSLSYDIIKAHGGELKVESIDGEGSVFTIILLV